MCVHAAAEVVVMEPLTVHPKTIADAVMSGVDAHVMGKNQSAGSLPTSIKSLTNGFRHMYMKKSMQKIQYKLMENYTTRTYRFDNGGVPVCLSVFYVCMHCMYVCMYVCIMYCMYMRLSVCLSVYLSVCLSVCLYWKTVGQQHKVCVLTFVLLC